MEEGRIMTECPRTEALIRGLVSGELTREEVEALRRHAETCEGCRAVVEIQQELLREAAEAEEPTSADFQVMRMRVLSGLPGRTGATGRWNFARDAWAFLRMHPTAAAFALLVLLGAAGAAGRWSARPAELSEAMLLRTVRQQASRDVGIDGAWDEPVSCSNVAVRPAGGDRLSLDFDVSRHVRLTTSRDSDLARELLAQAILEPSPLGQRLKAISFGREIMDRRLREALILALREDPELAVRLRALEVLVRYPFDESVQQALLHTLKEDSSVRLRLLALDFLAAKQVDGETLRRTIEAGDLASNDAVLFRAAELRSIP